MECFEAIAERIVEHDQIAHEALVGKRPRAARDLHTIGFKPRRQRIERRRVGGLPAEHRDALADAITVLGIDDDALLPVVHAERERVA